MNDIAAPILLVYIAKKLGVRVEMLEALAEDPTRKNALSEKELLEVRVTSPRQILIIVLRIFWRV
jgi:DUF1365 family protein